MQETFIASSSHLQRADYDSEARTLQVSFRDGSTYEYSGVPYDVWLGLQNAGSAGGYFVRQIKDRFAFEQL